MNWPPLIMKLRILRHNRNLRLWLPLLLIYPVLFVFALLLAPLVLIAGLLLLPWGWGKTLLLSGPYLYRVICALHELEVDIQQKNEQFFISFR